jgi:hypothetical protein
MVFSTPEKMESVKSMSRILKESRYPLAGNHKHYPKPLKYLSEKTLAKAVADGHVVLNGDSMQPHMLERVSTLARAMRQDEDISR